MIKSLVPVRHKKQQQGHIEVVAKVKNDNFPRINYSSRDLMFLMYALKIGQSKWLVALEVAKQADFKHMLNLEAIKQITRNKR